MHYEQYKQVAQRHQARACYAKTASSRERYKKQNRDGTQMKIKEATKNEANELKY